MLNWHLSFATEIMSIVVSGMKTVLTKRRNRLIISIILSMNSQMMN